MSKVLQRLADTDKRFSEYENDGSNGHFLLTAPGWVNTDTQAHAIRRDTVKAVLADLWTIGPCTCEWCDK